MLQVLTAPEEERACKLSVSSLLDVVAPMLQQFILEGKAAEDSGHEIKQVQLSLLAQTTTREHLLHVLIMLC